MNRDLIVQKLENFTTQIDKKIDDLANAFYSSANAFNSRIDGLENRIENRIDVLGERVDGLAGQIGRLNERQLRAEIAKKFGEKFAEPFTARDRGSCTADFLDQQQRGTKGKFNRHF